MTRRPALARAWRLVAVLLLITSVAAACGGSSGGDKGASSSGDQKDTATSQAAADPNGVLRIATTLASFNLDQPANWGSPVQLGIMYHVFGTPLQLQPDGTVGPYLAESYQVVDPTTFKLTLRKGLTFQNGDPYDATALKEAILANRALNSAVYDVAQTSEIADLAVDSPTQLTFKLKSPIAGQFPLLMTKAAAYATRPAPAGGFPVGAGPYKVSAFTPDNKLVLEKWDGFYDAAKYKIKQVEYLNIPTIEAAQNALEGGQVDLIATNPRDVDSLLPRGSFAKLVINNETHYMLATCKAAPPFDNVKFRQAFDLAIDREQLNQVVLGGNAKPMTSVWDPSSPYALDLFKTKADVTKAKALLKEINYDSSKSIPFGFFQGFQVHQLIAETIQGMEDKVGIKLDVKPMPLGVTNDLVNEKSGGVYVIANSNPSIQKIIIPITPGSPWDPCSYSDPKLQDIMNKISAGASDKAELKDLWTQAQNIVGKNYIFHPLLTQPAVYVYNKDKVAGVRQATVGLLGATAPSPYLAGAYIKAS